MVYLTEEKLSHLILQYHKVLIFLICLFLLKRLEVAGVEIIHYNHQHFVHGKQQIPDQ